MPDEPPKPDPSKIVAVPLDRARKARGEGVVAMPRSRVASLRAFRRIRADRFLGFLGAVLVVLGILLIFAWEKPPVPPKTFAVEWPLATTANFDRDVMFNTANQNQPQSFTVPVAGPNVTAVAFWLDWKDDQGDVGLEADNWTFAVEGPSGANLSLPPETIQSLAENRSRTYLMSGLPEIASVNALTEKQARSIVGDRSNLTGVGDYTFTFRLVRFNHDWKDNNVRDQVPCQVPSPYCTPDTEFRVKFHFHALTYSVRYEKNF